MHIFCNDWHNTVDLLRFTGKPGQNHCGSFETNEVGAESQSPFSER